MYRLSVPLSEDKRVQWKKFQKKEGYGSMASLVRSCVDGKINNERESPFRKQMEEIKIMFGSIAEGIEKNKEWMDFLDMRLNLKEGNSDLVCAAIREIQKLLLSGEQDFSNIIKKIKKYDKETLNAAIIFLYRIDRLTIYRKKDGKNGLQ